MDEWTGVNQNVEAQELGPEQELDILSNHCFFFMCMCVVIGFSDIQRRVFFFLSKKPTRHEDSPVLFCHFLPYLLFFLHLVLP